MLTLLIIIKKKEEIHLQGIVMTPGFCYWKALTRTSGLIGGFDPNTAFAIVMTPGFWLLKAAMATALVFPH